MSKVAIVSDSNSGITQSMAKELGVTVMPMPFFVGDKTLYEDIDLSQEEFYQMLSEKTDIHTSMPLVGNVTDTWDELLKEYDALALAKQGRTASEIKTILERDKFESSIYIMVDTLYYLKKGGRITPAAAALGTLLKLKPVLQIQGEKLDAFAKARTVKQAKSIMIEAMKNDFANRFNDPNGEHMYLEMAYTHDLEAAENFKKEVQEAFPGMEIRMDPLSLSISCHIGPGALAVACSRKIPELEA